MYIDSQKKIFSKYKLWVNHKNLYPRNILPIQYLGHNDPFYIHVVLLILHSYIILTEYVVQNM